jgi:predicted RNA-binding Zn-ribbon protein involved in translation (DUF1610 family)
MDERGEHQKGEEHGSQSLPQTVDLPWFLVYFAAPVHREGDNVARDLGTKYVCFKCGTRFYDLKKPVPACPKCGTDQRDQPVAKPASTRASRAAKAAEAAEEPEVPVPAEAEGEEAEEVEEEDDDED